MIITNALLNLAFGIITNFCSVLPADNMYAPKGLADFRTYVVGTPGSPTALHVVGPSGARFGMRDGAVYYFSTPESFFRQGDPGQLERYAGISALSTNQIVGVASNALHRLLKTNASLAGGTPKLRQGGVYKGKPMPFFQVEWPGISPGSHMHAADIEIDGRTGRVVFLHLLDDVFCDFRLAERITNEVMRPNADDDPANTRKAVDPTRN